MGRRAILKKICTEPHEKRKITKLDIAKAIANEYQNIGIRDVMAILNDFVKYVNLYLENGDQVVITNLGTWDSKVVPAGPRWNPARMDYVDMPEHFQLKYHFPTHMRWRMAHKPGEQRPKYFDENSIEE